MEHLRCQSPAQVEKEICAASAGLQFAASGDGRSGPKDKARPRELRFQAAVQTVNAFASYLVQSTDCVALWNALRHALAGRARRRSPRPCGTAKARAAAWADTRTSRALEINNEQSLALNLMPFG